MHLRLPDFFLYRFIPVTQCTCDTVPLGRTLSRSRRQLQTYLSLSFALPSFGQFCFRM